MSTVLSTVLSPALSSAAGAADLVRDYLAALWAGVLALPDGTRTGLACVAALLLVYHLLGLAAAASARRRTRSEMSRAWGRLAGHARRAGFVGYDMSFSRRNAAVTLWLWGEPGSYRAAGRARTRDAALAAAFAAILDLVPDEEPQGAFEGAAEEDLPDRAAGAAGPGPAGPGEPDAARTGPDDWWRDELGIGTGATLAEARLAFRSRAKLAHPDRGGSGEAMARLNQAWAEARLHLSDGALAGSL